MSTFATLLKANLTNLTPESPFGIFHIGLAKTLNQWFTPVLLKQIYTASGVVSYGAVSSPLVLPCVKPQNTNLYFDPIILQTVSATGENMFSELFKYIGTILSTQVTFWTGLPLIVGVGVGSLVTSHFSSLGATYKTIISQFDPASPTIFNEIWDLFENYLNTALNSIPLLTVSINGSALGGIFSGVGMIKFYA